MASQVGTAVSAPRWSPWWASIGTVTVAGGGPGGFEAPLASIGSLDKHEAESNEMEVTRRWTRRRINLAAAK